MFESQEKVLIYWFGYVNDKTILTKDSAVFKRWYHRDEKVDVEIKTKFEPYVISAQKGELSHWTNTMDGRVALILVLDQFSRHIYRYRPAAFLGDQLALRVTLQTIKEGKDEELMFIRRQFLYMPLMHSEDLAIQQMSLESFKRLLRLAKTFDGGNLQYYEYVYDIAKKHYEVIEMFGRFPHRNKVLDRQSTIEELGFLKLTKDSIEF